MIYVAQMSYENHICVTLLVVPSLNNEYIGMDSTQSAPLQSL